MKILNIPTEWADGLVEIALIMLIHKSKFFTYYLMKIQDAQR